MGGGGPPPRPGGGGGALKWVDTVVVRPDCLVSSISMHVDSAKRFQKTEQGAKTPSPL